MKIYLRIRKGNLSESNAQKGKVRKNSIYLLYCDNENKKRWYEFLKLSVYDKPSNELQKRHNKETMELAEKVCAQRVLDMQSSQYGFVSASKGKVGLLVYFKSLLDKHRESDGNHANWASAYKHLCNFCKGRDLYLERVDELFMEKFKKYLLGEKIGIKSKGGRLSNNSALSYFNKLKTVMNEAYQQKYIRDNPSDRVKSIKEEESTREFLTLEEIKLLVKTECKDRVLKKAFLFGCLTGLRFSDIQKLRWENFKHDEFNGWSISYTQKKTKSTHVLPVNGQVFQIIGNVGDSTDYVFYGLHYSCYRNKLLQEWVEKAGIEKKITFHCSRHSFAVLNISIDNDIYIVSKLLGHKNVATTQIYAKVADRKKVEAIGKIPNIYNS